MNPVKALTSGQFTTADIGKTVYLSNSSCVCQEWRIADINHDGTSGTVDLFPKKVAIGNLCFSDGNYYNKSAIYKISYLRAWLNGDFYNGFAVEVKNAMKVQNFYSNGEILSDKVKCPSVTEVGILCSIDDQGTTIYPIFSPPASRNDLAKFYDYSAQSYSTAYWTRTKESAYWVYYVKGNYLNDASCTDTMFAVACIRF